MHPDRAIGAIIGHENLDRHIVLHRCRQFIARHHKAAIPDKHNDLAPRSR